MRVRRGVFSVGWGLPHRLGQMFCMGGSRPTLLIDASSIGSSHESPLPLVGGVLFVLGSGAPGRTLFKVLQETSAIVTRNPTPALPHRGREPFY